jgi:hypothetical protein
MSDTSQRQPDETSAARSSGQKRQTVRTAILIGAICLASGAYIGWQHYVTSNLAARCDLLHLPFDGKSVSAQVSLYNDNSEMRLCDVDVRITLTGSFQDEYMSSLPEPKSIDTHTTFDAIDPKMLTKKEATIRLGSDNYSRILNARLNCNVMNYRRCSL